MTAIHYLLPYGEISALHRLRSDELWFFHEGVALNVVAIAPDGALTETRVTAQHVVPGGHWFGARLAPAAKPGDYAFVSCAVTPPFEYAHFELADRKALSAAYPQHARLIAEMTR